MVPVLAIRPFAHNAPRAHFLVPRDLEIRQDRGRIKGGGIIGFVHVGQYVILQQMPTIAHKIAVFFNKGRELRR